MPDGAEIAEMVADSLRERGLRGLHLISAVTHEGLPELTYAMLRLVRADRQQRPAPEARVVLRPQAGQGAGLRRPQAG
jgi:GTP-binding protein